MQDQRLPTISQGKYGPSSTISSHWSRAIEETLVNAGVSELELDTGKGWNGCSVDFLLKFPNLQSLTIIDHSIVDVDAVNSLSQLRALQLETYCKSRIDFANFPRLENCSLQWRSSFRSLSSCTEIAELFIDHYPGPDLLGLQSLEKLESLQLLNSRLHSLEGISNFKMIRVLRLGGLRSLESLAGLETLTMLETLRIQTCRRIKNLDPLAKLKNLKMVTFDNCGDIESLKPLSEIGSLEKVLFVESTNILDGDMSPLVRPHSPLFVSFQNRKHYSLRREELHAMRSSVS